MHIRFAGLKNNPLSETSPSYRLDEFRLKSESRGHFQRDCIRSMNQHPGAAKSPVPGYVPEMTVHPAHEPFSPVIGMRKDELAQDFVGLQRLNAARKIVQQTLVFRGENEPVHDAGLVVRGQSDMAGGDIRPQKQKAFQRILQFLHTAVMPAEIKKPGNVVFLKQTQGDRDCRLRLRNGLSQVEAESIIHGIRIEATGEVLQDQQA